jgi:hypothetical protein
MSTYDFGPRLAVHGSVTHCLSTTNAVELIQFERLKAEITTQAPAGPILELDQVIRLVIFQ